MVELDVLVEYFEYDDIVFLGIFVQEGDVVFVFNVVWFDIVVFVIVVLMVEKFLFDVDCDKFDLGY